MIYHVVLTANVAGTVQKFGVLTDAKTAEEAVADAKVAFFDWCQEHHAEPLSVAYALYDAGA